MKNRLRVLRAERESIQAELAELAERPGVSGQTIHAIEAEKYDPSLPLALAELLALSIENIFQPEPAARNTKP